MIYYFESPWTLGISHVCFPGGCFTTTVVTVWFAFQFHDGSHHDGPVTRKVMAVYFPITLNNGKELVNTDLL